MILLNDNDLCLISGGKNSTDMTRNLKKSKQECKQDIWSAFKEFFWDGCTILAETVKYSGVLWLTAYTIGLTKNTPSDLLKWLNGLAHPKTSKDENIDC